MQDEITRHPVDEGRDEETEKYEKEIEEEELDQKIEEARKRKKQRAKIWRPGPGEEKAVRVERVEEKASEFGKTKFFILKDLKENQLYSLIACGILLKNLKVGKSYLLEYQGKVEAEINNEIRQVHSWDFEEIR